MDEARIGDLPTGVWCWRRDSTSRWFIECEGWIGRLDSAEGAVRSDPDEIVLIDPNWCPVCFQQMPWPPGVRCPECGDDRNDGVSLDEFRVRIGEWAGIDPAGVHI